MMCEIFWYRLKRRTRLQIIWAISAALDEACNDIRFANFKWRLISEEASIKLV
jgi:hypothetical protein